MIENIDLYFPSVSQAYKQARADMLNKDTEGANGSFMEFLQQAMGQVNDNFIQAEDAMQGFLMGKNELHDVLMSMQKANMEFRFAMQVRNKLIETYQEVMRMQI